MLNLYRLGILKTSIYQLTKYLFVYAYTRIYIQVQIEF